MPSRITPFEKREREEKERKWKPESGTTGLNSKNRL